MQEVRRQSATPADGVRWPFIALCCLPLLAIRGWIFATKPQPYDFITYWASGHLFLTGGQPYSAAAMLTVERAQGWAFASPMLTFCPPWSMPLLAPLSALPFRSAQLTWFAFSLLLNGFSAIGLWNYFGGAKEKYWIPLLACLTFLPMAGAEHLGQITPLMLASLTAFLMLTQSERYFLAGLSLVGCGFKPHLLYLVFIAILLWAFKNRKWTLLAGAVLSYGLSTAAAFEINPNSIDYLRRSFGAAVEISCGLGGVFRSILGAEHLWLQFVPCAVGVAWFAWYWAKNRRSWEWQVHLPLLLLVSVSTSPYYWFHDFILILPAVIALAAQEKYRDFDTLVGYLVLQLLILASLAVSPAWMSAASILWIVLYGIAERSAPIVAVPSCAQASLPA